MLAINILLEFFEDLIWKYSFEKSSKVQCWHFGQSIFVSSLWLMTLSSQSCCCSRRNAACSTEHTLCSLCYLVVVIGRKQLRKITENTVCSQMFLITNVSMVHLPTWLVFFSCAHFFLLWKMISWCSQLNKDTIPSSELVVGLDPRFQAPLFSACPAI